MDKLFGINGAELIISTRTAAVAIVNTLQICLFFSTFANSFYDSRPVCASVPAAREFRLGGVTILHDWRPAATDHLKKKKKQPRHQRGLATRALAWMQQFGTGK